MHTRRLLAWIALGLLVVTGLVYGFVPRPVAVDRGPVARTELFLDEFYQPLLCLFTTHDYLKSPRSFLSFLIAWK